MTDAERTIKFAILSSLIDNYHRTYLTGWAEETKDQIFNQLFLPQYRWAIEEYLKENPSPNSTVNEIQLQKHSPSLPGES